MQKFYSASLIVIFTLLLSIGFNYYQSGEINAMKLQEKLYQCENRLLLDQLREYEYKASSSRTYEEGLMEGLVRSANVGYKDGYHAAMSQAEESRATYIEQERIKEQEKKLDSYQNDVISENSTTANTASK